MVAALARSDLHTSYRAGAGKLREHTLVFGSHIIAIDSIGSVTLVERGRTWWLALVGMLIAAGAAYAVSLYGPIAWTGAGAGALAIVVNLLAPVERHVSIGTSDGHVTTIHSNNSAFLRRLLDVLTEKINSQSAALLASFDIAGGTLHLVAPPAVAAPMPAPSPREHVAPPPDIAANDAGKDSEPLSESTIQPLRPATDVDEALFASDPEPVLKPRPANDAGREPPRAAIPATHAPAHDPLLDGPSVRPRSTEPDWMTHPNAAYGNPSGGQSGGAGRWLLPVLLFAILAGGAVAAWMVLRQSGGASAIAFLSPAPAEDASFEALASNPSPPPTTTKPAPETTPAPAPAAEPVEPAPPLPATPGFATLAPRILEPAEGVHLSGGPQLVRLAWSTLIEARTHVIEIEAYNATAEAWTDSWGPGRVTVGSDNEVAENIPAAGRWRWRVRGVAAAGEQSKFSAWSEFTVSD